LCFRDANIAMAYGIDLGSDFYIETTTKVIIPAAARSKRVGTGQVAFTLSTDLVKDVGKASFYLHGRWKFARKATGSTIRATWGAGSRNNHNARDGF
jgi:hypothetical protein